jgi:nitroreductase
MNTLDAIAQRRSIRRFRGDPLPDDALRAILQAATQAPSGKNRQPWRFIVVQGDGQRSEMLSRMWAGIEEGRRRGDELGSCEATARVMAQAPVTVFVFNPGGKAPWLDHSMGEMFLDVVDIQSAGAAIQNMLLAATELGIGSLWICDVFAAYGELSDWLGEDGELIAAVSLGYAAESPRPRRRKPVEDAVRWVGRE